MEALVAAPHLVHHCSPCFPHFRSDLSRLLQEQQRGRGEVTQINLYVQVAAVRESALGRTEDDVIHNRQIMVTDLPGPRAPDGQNEWDIAEVSPVLIHLYGNALQLINE
jgi:hypothetical protein